ncbi:MAG: hypothetical protein EON58_09130, partial [Alphaproteobacteria bacterium]
ATVGRQLVEVDNADDSAVLPGDTNGSARLTIRGTECPPSTPANDAGCPAEFVTSWKPVCDSYPCQNPLIEITMTVRIPEPLQSTRAINTYAFNLNVVRTVKDNSIEINCQVLNGIYNSVTNTCRPKYAFKTCADVGMPYGVIKSVHKDGAIECVPLRSGQCNNATEVVASIDSRGRAVCSPKVCPCRATHTGWAACSQSCGGGTQTETRNVVPALNGGAACSPPATQTCNSHSCNWVVGAFGSCSKACGGGLQTRSFQCVDPVTGSVTSNSACPAPVPTGSQSCNSLPCDWQYGTYGACSVPCGGNGVRTRSANCFNPNSVSLTAATNCPTAPIDSAACNEGVCPVACVGSFGPCVGGTCGTGTQTYSITQPRAGTGAPCPYVTGDTIACNLPACPATPTPAPTPAGTPVPAVLCYAYNHGVGTIGFCDTQIEFAASCPVISNSGCDRPPFSGGCSAIRVGDPLASGCGVTPIATPTPIPSPAACWERDVGFGATSSLCDQAVRYRNTYAACMAMPLPPGPCGSLGAECRPSSAVNCP